MDPKYLELVKSSFDKVTPIADTAAAMFYAKLFELDPTLKPLFKGDMKQQGRKLMAMIGAAVNGLGKLDQLIPVVQGLGRRHVGYGVKPEHYATVGTALLWTLEQGLGPDFTDETRDAWSEVYEVLATVMQDAAYGPPALHADYR